MAEGTDISLRNQVIYQIFVRNYGDGRLTTLREDLPRIRALGADWIYLMPIQPTGQVHRKGTAGSPYAIRDYRAVDPACGTMDDFIALTEAAHGLGMKVMLDVVYNHTSPDSVLAKEHPEWFYHKPDGSFGNRIGDWWDVVDLDYSQEGLCRYQIETLKMWARYVDGFRCDVAPLVPLSFWLRARAEVESVRRGCVWLAESVETEMIRECRKAGMSIASDGEVYRAFDICYDYDIYPLQKSAVTGRTAVGEYLAAVNLQESIYPANYVKLRCLENHDRPRAAAMIPNVRALRNWTAWIYFMKGTTMIYAGEEFLARHHPTLFDVDPVRLEAEETAEADPDGDGDLSRLMANLSEIRKKDIFRNSIFSARTAGTAGETIVAVHEGIRGTESEGRKAVGIFSTRGAAMSIHVDLPDGTYRNRISGRGIDVYEGILATDGEPVILLI